MPRTNTKKTSTATLIALGLFIAGISISFFYKDSRSIEIYQSNVQVNEHDKPKRPSADDLMKNWVFQKDFGKYSHRPMNCSRVDAGPATAEYPLILEKTVYHKTRFILVVGLEGTGHHLFKPLLANCETCESPFRITGFRFAIDQHKSGLFGSMMEPKDIKRSLTKFINKVWKIRRTFKPDAGKSVFLNTLGSGWFSGEASYPSFGGGCRKFQYPEARIAAELFEKNDMDLRIVVLIRNAVDILLSTSVHRHFGSWEKNAELYIEMMENVMLEAQLMRLDKRFIKCINYDELPDIQNDLGSFLGVDTESFSLKEEMSKFYHRSKDDEERMNEEAQYINDDIEKVYLKLQESIDKLKRFCSDL